MDLKERIYSVLIVSASEKFNIAISSLLSNAKYSPVSIVSSIAAAKRTFAEHSFDFIIINSPVSDDPGISFAIDTCQSKSTVTLLVVRAEIYDEIYARVVTHGVFALAKPASKSSFAAALSWMQSARERLRQSEKKSLSVEEKMEEIRLVNKAKWLLITHEQMSEPQAHRYIEKRAMDRCLSKRDIAREIIDLYP